MLATSISTDQKDKHPKSVTKGLPEQFGSTRYGSPHPVLLLFLLYNPNLNLFISSANLILNHLMRINTLVHWISFCRI